MLLIYRNTIVSGLLFIADFDAGIWDQILEHVSIEPDFESIMIDATIVHRDAVPDGANEKTSLGGSRRSEAFPKISDPL
ncbi:hypothetical protein J41TS4_09460 [Paenibacillus apis]|uniref:Uncharacterized protein n=1 Tax=Paenibacillus apis TaxID=1792174 RepID=A0A920CL10_9BACL|nr:hypothetical protein J41TS4_09460 [Paenibacillus apis]